MQSYNHLYSEPNALKEFLNTQSIDADATLLVQIFTGINDPQKLQALLDEISLVMPTAKMITTSTAGEIIDGKMYDDTTVVSITVFEKTELRVSLIQSEAELDMAVAISKMITPRSKLLIMFNNVYSNDAETIIEHLAFSDPDVMIAGGNSGDNVTFTQTVVGVGKEVSTTGLAVAILDSDDLQVHNSLLFNWQTIGEQMNVTKSENNTIYEINGQNAIELYRSYLGDEIADALPESGIEFPLIFQEDGLDIARAPVAIGENGSLIMAGHIAKGTTVQFGFGDISENDRNVALEVEEFSRFPVESIFIYSCSARKNFLKKHLANEFALLNKIAPTAGFITYGEFFKQKTSNKMLNVSSTFIGLSESNRAVHKVKIEKTPTNKEIRTLKALTHLVKQTSKNLNESIHSNVEFYDYVKAATIYSKTDLNGVITDVNDRFCTISGYSREELIGQHHNIVRHKDMPKKVFAQMWKTITAKEPWHGIIKNRAKDGSAYYVRSHVFPLKDTEGKILGYISLRDDITEEMEKQHRLEGTLNALEERSSEKDFLLNQYENIIDQSSAIARMTPNFGLLYANKVFCDLYKCSPDKITTSNITDFIEARYFIEHFSKMKELLKTEGSWNGIVPFQSADLMIYMETRISIIYNRKHEIVEYMMAMQNVTDLIMAQKEIEETQRDVVYTMGAIGETRSKETGNHVKRVAEYSRLLALYYGLDPEKVELLKMASPMHDIGKVGIPDAILNKPGKLDEKEWNIMKTHSMLGYQMLKNSKREILQTAAAVALTHHEKWDGTGYPKGTKGEDIDIYGRITAVADVFDALGSDRCYKKAWEDEKIFALLKEESGKHFDPRLIEIFFAHLDEFLAVRDKFVD